MIMEDNNRKRYLILYILIGVIFSTLLGMLESQLLLGKSLPYRENMLWKYTVLFYCLTGAYTLWLYFFKNHFPILLNLIKFVGGNFLLSLPYFTVLILTRVVSINAILIILPSQIIFLAGAFIWFIAREIDQELGENSTKIWLKILPVLVVVLAITVYFHIPETIVLSLVALTMLIYSLLLLRQAKKGT